MRTALITLAAAASALSFAAPASAQYYPQTHYPQQRGHAYGYGYNHHGMSQRLDARVEMLRRHVFEMHQRRLLSPAQARNLDRQAVSTRQRIWRASRNGLNRSELRSLDRRLDRLERQVQRQVARNSRHYGQQRYYGRRW